MTGPGGQAPGDGVRALVRTMDRLRSPGGCPWDAQQTHESLAPYALEEAYEVVEAIEQGDRAAVREELGDLLLQVVFHARLAQEHPSDPFDLDDVARAVTEKLVRRHPHVYGGEAGPGQGSDDRPGERVEGGAGGVDGDVPDPGGAGREAAPGEQGDLHAQWDRIKRAEKQRASVLDGVPLALGALARGQKVLGRARRAGIELDGPAATGWRAEAQVASPWAAVSSGDGSGGPGAAGTGAAGTGAAGTSAAGTGAGAASSGAAGPATGWQEAEIGRRLLELVAAADELGVDAETALRAALRGVERQVRERETQVVDG